MKKTLYLLFLNFLFISCASWNNPRREEAEMKGQVGASLLQAGSYPQALSALLEAESLDPSNSSIQNNLGLAYYYRGRSDLASYHLEKAIKLDKKFTEARVNWGRILIEKGDFDQAEVELILATKDLTYANPALPYYHLGLLYFKKKSYSQARKSLDKAINYDKTNCGLHTLSGRTFYELKQYDLAARHLDRAIGLCVFQSSEEAQYWAGMSYLALGNNTLAKARFEELIRLYPESSYKNLSLKTLKDKRLLK